IEGCSRPTLTPRSRRPTTASPPSRRVLAITAEREWRRVSTPTVTTGPLRRVPVQGRSVARVQRMLDACAELVDEVGYEGLTTTLLAERAEVAIGSVYQFFPDKRALVHALALRRTAGAPPPAFRRRRRPAPAGLRPRQQRGDRRAPGRAADRAVQAGRPGPSPL